MAICNACDWCRFCDIRFYLQQNKITKILNEKSRRKIFVRVENSVYITWHRHRIIFSFLYFFLRLIVVWGPPTETAYKKTVGLAAVLLCASNRGRSQTAVLKLIISRPPRFYTHGGTGGTPCFFALSMPLICQKNPGTGQGYSDIGCENCSNINKFLALCACAALCCASAFCLPYFWTKCPGVRGGSPGCRSPPALHFVSDQPTHRNKMEDKL